MLVKLLDTVLWMLSVRKNKVGTRPQCFLSPERKCCVSVTIAVILGVLQCSLWVLTNFWHSTKMYIRYVPPSVREVGLIGVKWRFPSFNCRFYFSAGFISLMFIEWLISLPFFSGSRFYFCHVCVILLLLTFVTSVGYGTFG